MLRLICIVLLACLAAPAMAQVPLREAAPAWVLPLETTATVEVTDAAPFRILSLDQQIHVGPTTSWLYFRSRTLIQSTQGLAAAGTVAGSWNPARQTLTVHAVNIVRGERTIDVLAGQEFDVIRREEGLEAATLTGVLTATLTPADLRVGDVLDVSYTLSNSDPLLGHHVEALTGGQLGLPVDRYRLRATWPVDQPVRVRALEPWTIEAPRRTGDRFSVGIEATALQPLAVPVDAPARFQHVRQFELTDYRSWSEVAAVMAPLFEPAMTLESGSPLGEEIERIRSTWATPEQQAAAALRLVQDDVRYVARAMGEGGYVPETADQTWRNRYGDCKAKTALLVALLRGLGITAEPALVSTILGDGLDQRLPMLAVFDHVLVRVTIGDRVWFIDGTHTGDRSLDTATTPPYRWALPVRMAGAELGPIPVGPLEIPSMQYDIAIDASGGLDGRVPASADFILRGDAAQGMRAAFATLSAVDRDAAVRDMWADTFSDQVIDTVGAAYDDAAAEFRITMAGTTRLEWSIGSQRQLDIPESVLRLPVAAARPAGPYADLPYAQTHPIYLMTRLRLTLPAGRDGFTLDGADVDRTIGAMAIRRATTLAEGVVTMVVSSRTLATEMTSAGIAAAREEAGTLSIDPVRILAPEDYRPTESDLRASSEDTDDIDTLITRGQLLLNRKEFPAALVAFDKAIELAPDDAHAHANRGRALLYTGDFEAARTELSRALELDSTEVFALEAQGLLALQERRFNDAVVEFTLVLRLSEENPTASHGRGYANRHLGKLDRALVDFHAASDAAGRTQFLPNLIRLLVAMGREPEARLAIDERLARNPEDGVVLSMRSWVALKSGDLASAAADIERALAVKPEDKNLYLIRAEIRARQGDVEGAIADLATIRTLPEADNFSRNSICWLSARMAIRLDEAMADCDAAIAGTPATLPMYDARGLLLLQLDRPEEALAVYDIALRNDPVAETLYGRGLAKRAMGRREEGETEIARALAMDPRAGEAFDIYERRRPSSH